MYIDKKVLTIKISNSARNEPTILRFGEYPLKVGAWYHFCIKYTKPRLSLFAKDELTVHLDQQLIFQDFVKFPTYFDHSSNGNNTGNINDLDLSFGENLDGQMGPIYVFNEPLPAQVIESIARLDAKRPVDGIDNSLNPIIVDLLPQILNSADRKIISLMSKVTAAYHPLRCSHGKALEIHSSLHATMGNRTRNCSITAVRDTLASVGGIYALLPLFPQLLTERIDYERMLRGGTNIHEITSSDIRFPASNSRSLDFSSVSESNINSQRAPPRRRRLKKSRTISSKQYCSSLGTSLSLDLDWHCEDSYLDYQSIRKIKEEKAQFDGDQCIGILLTVLAKCVVGHKLYKQDLLRYNAIEMIERALSFASTVSSIFLQ